MTSRADDAAGHVQPPSPGRGKVCVIAIGNAARGDDALGPIVAERLKASMPAAIDVMFLDGEPAGLIEALGTSAGAILIDAALTGAAPGTIHRFDAAAAPLPEMRHDISTHGIGVGQALELARALGALPRRCIVYAVEARSFAPGAPLSADVTAAIAPLIARVRAELA